MFMKKAALGFALAGCFLFPSPSLSFAAPQTQVTVGAREENSYHLINDSTGIYAANARNGEENELKKIFSSTEDKSSAFRIYSFIYDSANLGIQSKENDLVSKADLGGSVSPIIFIYNTADKDYKFVIDEKATGLIPKAYLQNEMQELILSKERPTSADFDEFLNRVSTMLVASYNAGLVHQENLESSGMKVDESKFEVRDFRKSPTKEKKTEKKPDEEKKQGDGSDMTLAVCAILILVIATGAVIFKRKESNGRKTFGGR